MTLCWFTTGTSPQSPVSPANVEPVPKPGVTGAPIGQRARQPPAEPYAATTADSCALAAAMRGPVIGTAQCTFSLTAKSSRGRL
jgi:hypothetical protein